MIWLNPRLKIGVFKFWTTEYRSTLASNLLWVCARGGRFSGAGKGRYTPRQASHGISLRSNGTSEFKDMLPDECQRAAAVLLTHTLPAKQVRGHPTAGPRLSRLYSAAGAGMSEFKTRRSRIRGLGSRRGPARRSRRAAGRYFTSPGLRDLGSKTRPLGTTATSQRARRASGTQQGLNKR